MQSIAESVDSIRLVQPDARIVVAGDFNDEALDASVQFLAGKGLADVPPILDSTVLGTYRYKGHWQSIDHILVSDGLRTKVDTCFIPYRSYMIEPDPTYGGVRPKRTYVGFKYAGVTSDHLPLLLRLKME